MESKSNLWPGPQFYVPKDVRALEQKLTDLEKRIPQLEDQNKALTKENQIRKAAGEELAIRSKQAEEVIRSRLAEGIRDEVTALEKKLASETQAKKELQTAVKQCIGDKTRLEEDKKRLEKKLGRFQEKCENIETAVSKMRNEHQRAITDARERSKEELTNERKEKRKFEVEAANLKSQLDTIRTQSEKQRSATDAFQGLFEKMKGDASAKISDLKKTLGECQKEKEKLQLSLKKMTSDHQGEMAAFELQLNEVTTELEEAENTNQRHLKADAYQKKNREMMSKAIGELGGELKVMRADLEKMAEINKGEFDEFKNKITLELSARLEKITVDHEANVSELERRLLNEQQVTSALQEQLAEETGAKQELKSELDSLGNKHKMIIDDYEEKMQDLKKETEEYKKSCSSLKERIDTMTDNEGRLNEKISQCDLELSAAQEQIKGLQALADQNKKEITESEIEKQQLVQDLEEIRKTTEALEKQNTEYREKLKQEISNSSKLMAESQELATQKTTLAQDKQRAEKKLKQTMQELKRLGVLEKRTSVAKVSVSNQTDNVAMDEMMGTETLKQLLNKKIDETLKLEQQLNAAREEIRAGNARFDAEIKSLTEKNNVLEQNATDHKKLADALNSFYSHQTCVAKERGRNAKLEWDLIELRQKLEENSLGNRV